MWAWTHPEHLLKKETPALGGEVEDLAWDGESKRIVAVGGGASKAKVFAWDTGSNLGDIIPHTKKIITCDLRPTLPHRLVMGGEDFNVSFYTGAPFKYSKGIKEHSNFVNCARFSPTGALFVTVSSDRTAKVYAGESGACVGRLDPAGMHAGSVFAACWSPDGARLVTAAGDKAVKIWNMAPALEVGGSAGPSAAAAGGGGAGAGAEAPAAALVDCPCIATHVAGASPADMQQSVVWLAGEQPGGAIVATALDGTLSFYAPATLAEGPLRRVSGHSEPMLALEADPATGALLTACSGGRVCLWAPLDEGRSAYSALNLCATPGSGAHAPTKRCAGVAMAGGLLAVIAWDDKLRTGTVAPPALTGTVALGAQPRALAVSPAAPELRIVVTAGAVLSVLGGAVVCSLAAPWRPTCCDVSRDGALVVVGGEDKKVHFYALHAGSGALTEAGEGSKEAGAAISCCAISPDGACVAAGDAGRGEVRLFAAQSRECTVSGRWCAHTTRVTGLKWSPSGAALASVASDRRLCVWREKEDSPALTMDLAHPHPFAACSWASNSELWVLGTDGVAVKRALKL